MINLYDRTSIMKSIDDHSRLIQRYQQAGYLDRNEAVSKIQELRFNDKEVHCLDIPELMIN